MARVIGDRYRLIAQLGGGGMADVFLAKLVGTSDFQKLAVVKRLKRDHAKDPDVEPMFRDEARLCALLNHPNIVQAFEVGQDDEGPFLLMEYIEGQTLSRIRSRAHSRGTSIPLRLSLQILTEVLAGLHYAHTLTDHEGKPLRVVHRDVSPQNIVVTYAGTTKLVDFGVAKNASAASETRAGTFKGKVAYMAPEQARLGSKMDGRADVFSAGVILWEMLTGKRMWEGSTEVQVLTTLLDTTELPTVLSVNPQARPELAAICDKAMAKQAEERYPSAAAFLDALEAALAKLELRASPRELSTLVTNLFSEDREQVRGLVGKFASEPISSSSLPSLAPPKGEDGESVSARLLPLPPPTGFSDAPLRNRSETAPTLTTGSRAAVEVAAPQLSMPPERKSVLVPVLLGIGVLGILGGVGFLVSTRHPAPAIVVPSAVPSAVPPPVNEEVTIEVSTTPPSAKVTVDGRPSSNPLQLRTLRNAEVHEIKADAPGYEPKTLSLSFDRDRSVVLGLAAKAKPVVPAPPPVAPPPPPPPPVPKAAAKDPPPPPPVVTAPVVTSPQPAKGISEIDPSKRAPAKHDPIDTDVFKR